MYEPIGSWRLWVGTRGPQQQDDDEELEARRGKGSSSVDSSCTVRVRYRIPMGQPAHAQPDVAGWTPAVLTEYEIGRVVWAAEIVAKSSKPVVEIGSRAVDAITALEDDLRECLKLASESEGVKVWTRAAEGRRVRYGFYRDAWVVGALDFLDRTELPAVDRAWINGLLFGYRSDAIQRFVDRLAAATTG